jgi:hypothetical protein
MIFGVGWGPNICVFLGLYPHLSQAQIIVQYRKCWEELIAYFPLIQH